MHVSVCECVCGMYRNALLIVIMKHDFSTESCGAWRVWEFANLKPLSLPVLISQGRVVDHLTGNCSRTKVGGKETPVSSGQLLKYSLCATCIRFTRGWLDLLRIQIPGSQLKPYESMSLGVVPRNLHFNELLGDSSVPEFEND